MRAKLAVVLHGKLLAISIAGVVIIGGVTAVAVAARSGALPVSHGAESPTTTAHTDANDDHSDDHSDDQHELHGAVSTINSDSFVLKPTTGAPVTVTISSHTQFHDGLTGLSGLKAGDAVEVDGTLQSDGTFAATDVEASSNDENDADEQGAKDLHGTVASIGANSFVLTISGESDDGDHSGHVGAKVTVTISSTTTFRNLRGLSALKVGEQVAVKGTLQADGTLAASSVEAAPQGNTSGGD